MKKSLHGLSLALFFLFAWAASAAQEPFGFDELAASEEIESIRTGLDGEDVDSEFLANASSRIVGLETRATSCVAAAGTERARLEQRYEPLIEITDDVPPELMDQRIVVRASPHNRAARALLMKPRNFRTESRRVKTSCRRSSSRVVRTTSSHWFLIFRPGLQHGRQCCVNR